MAQESLDTLQKEWEAEFSYGPTHIIKRKIVSKILQPLQGLRILDLGCGGGSYTALLEKANRVIAMDLSLVSVEKTKLLREHQGMNLVAQILQLPFPDDIFDAVVAFDILEHIDQDEGAVQEIYRVLKPKGKLLFVVPEDMTLFSPIDVANGHFRRYNLESIRKLLAAFNLVNLSDFGFPLMRLYLRLFAKKLLTVRSQNSPTLLIRFLSPFVVGVFYFDRLFNGSFRGVEIFGVAQKPG